MYSLRYIYQQHMHVILKCYDYIQCFMLSINFSVCELYHSSAGETENFQKEGRFKDSEANRACICCQEDVS